MSCCLTCTEQRNGSYDVIAIFIFNPPPQSCSFRDTSSELPPHSSLKQPEKTDPDVPRQFNHKYRDLHRETSTSPQVRTGRDFRPNLCSGRRHSMLASPISIKVQSISPFPFDRSYYLAPTRKKPDDHFWPRGA